MRNGRKVVMFSYHKVARKISKENSADTCEVSAMYFEYSICGKCCARHLERILWRDKDGDLFRLFFGRGSSN